MADEISNGTADAGAQLSLQKVYIKDVSFEVPGAPQIFQDQGQPQIQLNLSQQIGALAENACTALISASCTTSSPSIAEPTMRAQ